MSAPYTGPGCCQAAYDSDGHAHDHPVAERVGEHGRIVQIRWCEHGRPYDVCRPCVGAHEDEPDTRRRNDAVATVAQALVAEFGPGLSVAFRAADGHTSIRSASPTEAARVAVAALDIRPQPQDLAQLRENLAAIEHQRWADWQRYMHTLATRAPDGALVIPPSLVERWERQIATAYADLSEAERDSDREQVDRYWPIVEQLQRERDEALADREAMRQQLTQTEATLRDEFARLEGERDVYEAEVAKLNRVIDDLAGERHPDVTLRALAEYETSRVRKHRDALMAERDVMRSVVEAAHAVLALHSPPPGWEREWKDPGEALREGWPTCAGCTLPNIGQRTIGFCPTRKALAAAIEQMAPSASLVARQGDENGPEVHGQGGEAPEAPGGAERAAYKAAVRLLSRKADILNSLDGSAAWVVPTALLRELLDVIARVRPMSEPTIRLFSSGLLSKWGFNDGTVADGLADWLEANAADVYDYVTYDWTPILRRLVRERLVPALDQDVTAVDIETSHNPIRAETVDGIDVTNCWYGAPGRGPQLTPEYVDVPYVDVLAMIREAADV